MTADLVQEAVQQHLTATGEVSALIGHRVYPGVLPQTVTYPAMAYRRVGSQELSPSFLSSGKRSDRTMFRFFSTATSYAQAAELADALVRRLNGFAGVIGQVRILGAQSIQEIDFYDEETRTHQVASDYEVTASYAVGSP